MSDPAGSDPRPVAGAATPDEPLLPEEEDEVEAAGADVGDVPAGRAGADSGAADAVRVDPDDEAAVPDRSRMNDTPGVGPRPPDE